MGGDRPKPLVTIGGVPLVERNLLAALGAGAQALILVVPAAAPDLRAWAEGRATRLCAALGVTLQIHVEWVPGGTGGCLSFAGGTRRPVLMIYADNLTGLDLAAFDRAHEATGADVTVAVHDEPFTLSFGRVRQEAGRLTGYDEKPTLPITIASGAYLFDGDAVSAVEPARAAAGRLDVPDLIRLRLATGRDVRTFMHTAAWIDVNDAAARLRAERLLGQRPELERWARIGPLTEVCGAVLTRGDEVLLERRPETAKLYPAAWDTPGGKIEPGESPEVCIARELQEELGLHGLTLSALVTFDDVEPRRGWVRHHVFRAELGPDVSVAAREGQTLAWHPVGATGAEWALPAVRSLAYLGDPGAGGRL